MLLASETSQLPAEQTAGEKLIKGPNIASLPGLAPPPDRIEAPVLLKVGDDVSTDEISPAGARDLPLRSVFGPGIGAGRRACRGWAEGDQGAGAVHVRHHESGGFRLERQLSRGCRLDGIEAELVRRGRRRSLSPRRRCQRWAEVRGGRRLRRRGLPGHLQR
ncbi:hypothetical protein GCM10009753_31430 [Streptantibioticus ferralitis]